MSSPYNQCEKHGCQMRMEEIGRGKTVPVCDKCNAEARAQLDAWPVFQYLKATSDVTEGQMVPWVEFNKMMMRATTAEAEIAALRAKLEAAEKKLRRWQTDWTCLCAAIVRSPTTAYCGHHKQPRTIDIDDVRQRLISEYYRLGDERAAAFAALDAKEKT